MFVSCRTLFSRSFGEFLIEVLVDLAVVNGFFYNGNFVNGSYDLVNRDFC